VSGYSGKRFKRGGREVGRSILKGDPPSREVPWTVVPFVPMGWEVGSGVNKSELYYVELTSHNMKGDRSKGEG
jgi:hypothetical protein